MKINKPSSYEVDLVNDGRTELMKNLNLDSGSVIGEPLSNLWNICFNFNPIEFMIQFLDVVIGLKRSFPDKFSDFELTILLIFGVENSLKTKFCLNKFAWSLIDHILILEKSAS